MREQYPVNIGAWESYRPYHDANQLELQRANLQKSGLSNQFGEISFIYTKQIHQLNQYIKDISSQIQIVDTAILLEDEVFYTAKIEGAKTTRLRTTELHNGAKINESNAFSEYMVKNGFLAVKVLNLYGNRITKQNLIRVWTLLTNNCRDNEDIRGEEYRNGSVFIGDFEAAPPSKINDLVNHWIAFYNGTNMQSEPFIKTCLLHYAFETIHPFCDGNGRLGRLLLNNFLLKEGVDAAKAVSFSMEIDKTRALYDGAFLLSENCENDCTPFLEYMLDVMANAYQKAYTKQQKSKEVQKELDL